MTHRLEKPHERCIAKRSPSLSICCLPGKRDETAQELPHCLRRRRPALEHFAEEAELACLLGNDADNLRNAIQSEIYEVDWLYHDFAEQATAAGDTGAAARFAEVGWDESGHRDAFKAALQKLEADLEAGNGLAIPAGALSCMTS